MSGPAAAVLSPQKASPTRPISRVNERAFRDRLEPAEQAVFDACDANQRRRWMEGDILRSSLTAEERDVYDTFGAARQHAFVRPDALPPPRPSSRGRGSSAGYRRNTAEEDDEAAGHLSGALQALSASWQLLFDAMQLKEQRALLRHEQERPHGRPVSVEFDAPPALDATLTHWRGPGALAHSHIHHLLPAPSRIPFPPPSPPPGCTRCASPTSPRRWR